MVAFSKCASKKMIQTRCSAAPPPYNAPYLIIQWMMAPIRGEASPFRISHRARLNIAWEGEREADVLYTVKESAPFDGRKRTR